MTPTGRHTVPNLKLGLLTSSSGKDSGFTNQKQQKQRHNCNSVGKMMDPFLLKKNDACLREKTKKAMAAHSSTLAWKIPWTEEPGRLQSMGSRRVGHDGVTSLSLFTFLHWRRKWQPTPVFLPGESRGQGSLVGCRLWGHTASDTAEAT